MTAKTTDRTPRLMSGNEFLRKKFQIIEFDGVWGDVIGNPALSGMWTMWGNSGNGKTAGALQLALYLSKFKKVMYWSKEEEASATLQMALRRSGATEKELGRILIPSKDYNVDHLRIDLRQPKSAGVVFFDSLQVFQKIYSSQFYLDLKEEFSSEKLFVFVSQAEGENPKGTIGDDAKYMSDVKMHVKGFRITNQGRIEGAKQGAYYTVWEEGAAKYWGSKQ